MLEVFAMTGFTYTLLGTLILVEIGAFAVVLGVQAYRALSHQFYAVPITHAEVGTNVRVMADHRDSSRIERKVA